MVCGSFTLGRLFDFNSAHFWPYGALNFSLKHLFCGESFLKINSVNMALLERHFGSVNFVAVYFIWNVSSYFIFYCIIFGTSTLFSIELWEL